MTPNNINAHNYRTWLCEFFFYLRELISSVNFPHFDAFLLFFVFSSLAIWRPIILLLSENRLAV